MPAARTRRGPSSGKAKNGKVVTLGPSFPWVVSSSSPKFMIYVGAVPKTYIIRLVSWTSGKPFPVVLIDNALEIPFPASSPYIVTVNGKTVEVASKGGNARGLASAAK